jgi:hypothetical protein
MKVSTEIDNNFGYEKITQLVDNIPLIVTTVNKICVILQWLPFGFLVPKDIDIIWFFNLLTERAC